MLMVVCDFKAACSCLWCGAISLMRMRPTLENQLTLHGVLHGARHNIIVGLEI